jgi:predicted DNA-binding transcriptional regulator YafY
MAVDYSRIHRLLKILTLIQGSKGWTPRRLALECGTTERTIYRDMKMLEGAGIPYFFDEQEKCYSIRRDFFLPPLQLTLDEALSLAVLAEHVGGAEHVPFTKAASRAISKVRGQLPAGIRNELGRIEDRVAIKLAATNPPEGAQDVFQVVRAALASRKALRCKYDSMNGHAGPAENGAFILKPFTLFFNHRAWYVVGHRRMSHIASRRISRSNSIWATPGEWFGVTRATPSI